MLHFGNHNSRKRKSPAVLVSLDSATINNVLDIPNPLPIIINGQNGPIEIKAPEGNPLSVSIDAPVALKPFDEGSFTPFFISGAADQSILAGAAYGKIIHHSNIGTEDYIEILEGGRVIAKLYQDGIFPVLPKTDFAQQKEWRTSAYTVRSYGNIYSIDFKYPKL